MCLWITYVLNICIFAVRNTLRIAVIIFLPIFCLTAIIQTTCFLEVNHVFGARLLFCISHQPNALEVKRSPAKASKDACMKQSSATSKLNRMTHGWVIMASRVARLYLTVSFLLSFTHVSAPGPTPGEEGGAIRGQMWTVHPANLPEETGTHPSTLPRSLGLSYQSSGFLVTLQRWLIRQR